MSGLEALRFLHETGGWLDSDPLECRVHAGSLRAFERKGWAEVDWTDSGEPAGAIITKAGHEAYQAAREGGKPDPSCHGCQFHYSKILEPGSTEPS